MPTHRFAIGSRFNWRGARWEVRRLLPEDQINVEDIVTGAVATVALATFVESLFADELRFEDRRGTSGTAPAKVIALDDYPDHVAAIARYRFSVIEPLLALPRGERTRAVIEQRVVAVQAQQREYTPIAGMKTVSYTSIYRWIRDYQTAGDIRALIPQYERQGPRGHLRLEEQVHTIIDQVIQNRYLVRERVTIDDIHREIAVRIGELNRARPDDERLTMPGRSTVARHIDALDVADLFAAKHGARAARRALRQYGQTSYPVTPLDRVEIDHTRADFIVIDDRDSLPLGRLTLTYAIDMSSRYPCGYYLGFEPPSFLTVGECLHHAIWPKGDVRKRYGTEHQWLAFGVPQTLVIDNGKEFIGRDLEDACASLNIDLLRSPIATPEFKGGIERAFRTLSSGLFHTLPGTTLSNILERGDYDAASNACVYLSDIDRILHLYVLDIYAESFHRGLEGIPARRWEQATHLGFSPRLPSSAEDLRILLGRVEDRVIAHYGIEFQALRYNHPDLLSLRVHQKGNPVRIKYNAGDISRIWALDPRGGHYIEVPALAQEYTRNLSLWKHKLIRKAVLMEQDTVDLEALGRAKRRIQEIVDAGRARKQIATRTRIARWDTAGRASRDIEPQSEQTPVQVIPFPALPVPTTPALPAPVDEIELPDIHDGPIEGWDISYDLPRSRRTLPGENKGESQ